MNINLPDPTQQATTLDAHHGLAHAVEEAIVTELAKTYHRDDSKLPAIGAAPPVPQPGRPPMSQRAVDLNTTILTSSVLATALGGAATGILWASGQADPTVIAWVCGCVVAVPVALTLPVLALKSLVKGAKEVVQAAPAPVHHHYNGNVTVDQRSIHATTRGVIATTRNELPR